MFRVNWYPNISDPSQKFNRMHHIRVVMYKVHQSLYLRNCGVVLCAVQSAPPPFSSITSLLVPMI